MIELDPYSYYGEVLRRERLGEMTLTETAYRGSMSLPDHSHGGSHLAILLEGSYLERIGSSIALRLPGDAVHYAPDVRHENLFGDTLGRCLNLEFPVEAQAPCACRADGSYVPTEIDAIVRSAGSVRVTLACEWVAKARARIDADPFTSLGPLADELCVHSSHLARCFRGAYGLSVGAYVKLRRLRSAACMVVAGDSPLGEVALSAGFYDQSHFTTEFARVTGFTPAGLRRRAQA